MDWQARYEARDTPWDEGAAHPALVDFVEAEGMFQGMILMPGSGLGNDVRAVSGAGNRVIGLDIAPGAIEGARAFPKSGSEEYLLADLFELEAGMRGVFDWVIEHTCFCAIDPSLRGAYAAAVAGTLKPGGRLFAIFYVNPAPDHQPPYGVAVEELDALFSPFFALEREWVPARTFEGREGRELIRVLRRL